MLLEKLLLSIPIRSSRSLTSTGLASPTSWSSSTPKKRVPTSSVLPLPSKRRKMALPIHALVSSAEFPAQQLRSLRWATSKESEQSSLTPRSSTTTPTTGVSRSLQKPKPRTGLTAVYTQSSALQAEPETERSLKRKNIGPKVETSGRSELTPTSTKMEFTQEPRV